MNFLNLLVSLLVSSVSPQYQQWIDINVTDDKVNRLWIQPRFDKGPGYNKFIYRTIRLPIQDDSVFHDFLGWINCPTQEYLIEISGITYKGNTYYTEKGPEQVPFYMEPVISEMNKIIDLTCGNGR